MTLELLRDVQTSEYTSGRLAVNGVFQAYTLEPGTAGPHPAIPVGTYPVAVRFSERFQCLLPHVDQVPGRSAIEIHPGNAITDTHGCILLGQQRLTAMVLNSREAVHQLMVKLAQTTDPITLTIEDA